MVHAFLHRNHILFASRESCSSEKKKKKQPLFSNATHNERKQWSSTETTSILFILSSYSTVLSAAERPLAGQRQKLWEFLLSVQHFDKCSGTGCIFKKQRCYYWCLYRDRNCGARIHEPGLICGSDPG